MKVIKGFNYFLPFVAMITTYPATASDENATIFNQTKSPIVETVTIGEGAFAGETLSYERVGDLAIFEGDILLNLSNNSTADFSAKSVTVTGFGNVWPGGVVPYEIDGADESTINSAIAHWESNTNYTFVERTSENAAIYPDYVRIVDGDACNSYVGRIGGAQQMTLGSGCGVGAAIHEFGHAVGLYHEHNRNDRDEYITVHFDNICPEYHFAFERHGSRVDHGDYDYASIMHYHPRAALCDGEETFTILGDVPAGVIVGGASGLSAGDIAGAMSLLDLEYELTGFKRLQNYWKRDHYVHNESNRNWPELGQIDNGWWSAMWEFIPHGDYYVIQNRWQPSQKMYLNENISMWSALALGDVDPDTDLTARWILEPEKEPWTGFYNGGERLDGRVFVIRNAKYPDRYLNFEYLYLGAFPIEDGWWSARWILHDVGY